MGSPAARDRVVSSVTLSTASPLGYQIVAAYSMAESCMTICFLMLHKVLLVFSRKARLSQTHRKRIEIVILGSCRRAHGPWQFSADSVWKATRERLMATSFEPVGACEETGGEVASLDVLK